MLVSVWGLGGEPPRSTRPNFLLQEAPVMWTLNVQFHMLFEELIDFTAEARSRYGLEVELERFYPAAALRVPLEADLRAEISKFGHVDRFWLDTTLSRKNPETRSRFFFGESTLRRGRRG